jgi:hypothetical protein
MNKMCLHWLTISLLALISFVPLAQAHEIGRLFFTPAERNQLDQQQKQFALRSQMQGSDNNNPQPSITVNGLIKRGDGSRIVWINGRQQRLGKGGNSNKVPVTVPGKNKPVEVKVGQRIFIDAPAPPKSAAPATQDEDDD